MEKQYFTVVLFVFQCYPVCNFALGITRSESVYLRYHNQISLSCYMIYPAGRR